MQTFNKGANSTLVGLKILKLSAVFEAITSSFLGVSVREWRNDFSVPDKNLSIIPFVKFYLYCFLFYCNRKVLWKYKREI